jgi:uncharacterized RDD family membrane protein YckC
VQRLVTGEAVALDLRPAALPSRIVAGLIDVILQLVLFFGVGALLEAVTPSVSDAATSALGVVFLVLVLIGYPVAFETLLRGRTPGKAVMGLRVVRDDGGPIGFRQALVRGLAGAFLERAGITLFVGAIATMLLNPQSKRIGDLLAGTVVLQERVAVRGGRVAAMPPQLAAWAATTDLAGVSDELALSVRQFLARAGDLTDAAREDLGGRLLTTVLGAVTPPPPSGAPGWAVLSAVLAERRRREELRLATPEPQPVWGPSPAYGPGPQVPPAPDVPPLAPPDSEPPAAPPAPGPGGFVVPS